MSASLKGRGECRRGVSVCSKILHRGHEIEFHTDEGTGKHFRPGASKGEKKQEIEREGIQMTKSRKTRGRD